MAATPEHAARVLGLDDNATLADVRRVRKEMALKYHPDRCADQEMSTRHMARINAAADTLTDHLKKQGTRPNNPDFAKRHRAEQSSERTSAQHQTCGATSEGPEETNRKSTTQDTTGDRVSPSARRKAKTGTDSRLIRFAADSYAMARARIGKPNRAPTVDVRVLSFQTAA